MKKQLIEYPTIGGPIRGTVYSIVQLSAKFQIWARKAGVTDSEGLAYLVCDKPSKWPHYFTSEAEVMQEAEECKRKISGLSIPEDFGEAIPSSKIGFEVITINI